MTKPIRITQGRVFQRRLKQLAKKYPHVRQDLDGFTTKLQAGETPGDQIPGVGYPVYKVRIPNRDAQRGSQGGYRVIYYIHVSDLILLVTIYAKVQQEDIAPELLRQIIQEEIGNLDE